jgi:hypothetical protein
VGDFESPDVLLRRHRRVERGRVHDPKPRATLDAQGPPTSYEVEDSSNLLEGASAVDWQPDWQQGAPSGGCSAGDEAAGNAGGMAVGVGNKGRVDVGDRDSATLLGDVVT